MEREDGGLEERGCAALMHTASAEEGLCACRERGGGGQAHAPSPATPSMGLPSKVPLKGTKQSSGFTMGPPSLVLVINRASRWLKPAYAGSGFITSLLAGTSTTSTVMVPCLESMVALLHSAYAEGAPR